MNLFKITEKKKEELLRKMTKYGISEKDLIEKFIRSSGRYHGQKCNGKTKEDEHTINLHRQAGFAFKQL